MEEYEEIEKMEEYERKNSLDEDQLDLIEGQGGDYRSDKKER